LTIPFEPIVFGIHVNIHLITEYLAFFIAFRYYVYLRKEEEDEIATSNRLSLILGAIIGALTGSRLMGYFENPTIEINVHTLLMLYNTKTIMGGLFGGLIGVEISKKIIGEKRSSGDLFTLPILVGLFIGRIGCFLSGIKEYTYGSETSFFLGMNLGDDVLRHPTSLYELAFVAFLFVFLRNLKQQQKLESGMLFQFFMISYFGFRFLIEFIKPNQYFILGLSSIQWLCILCWIYYAKTIKNILTHAH